MFIQQSVKHDKDKYVKGTYVVSSKDPEYLKELEKNESRTGYVDFYYDVETNKLDFEFHNCQEYAQRNYQELVETVWRKIRLIRSYWKTADYMNRTTITEDKK